jgi:outer membrane protein OmpA-like peptidoglycan-associated protein
MRTAIILLSVLLFVWIAGSSYVYVCNVRKDCCVEKTAEKASIAVPEASKGISDTLRAAAVVPQIPVPPMHIIYFDLNKSICSLKAENISHFELLKKYLSANAGKKVKVAGHSDAAGPEWIKEKISAQRAEFIRQKLSEAGIALGAIETVAESDHKPAMDNGTPEGRAKNRRTEILIQ